MNQIPELDETTRERVHRILGYLNFSSGAEDPAMLRDLSDLFTAIHDTENPQLTYETAFQTLSAELKTAGGANKALADCSQAKKVLELTVENVIPEYLHHHRDLLFHRSNESIFNAFFVGRIFEAVLSLQEHHGDSEQLAKHAVGKLNDFIGHRPVATLETQKLEPYDHEWVRPIPIYIRKAGVVHHWYQDVIECCINLLKSTDPEMLELAQFDPELLDELAVDPRSFDFDHPVNKRPNHHFGQWDEHHIDNNGHYRRFVIHQVTLDALTSRIDEPDSIPREQLVLEAGSVLAGTILMAAGICGYGPGAHDSTVTLSNLLPIIAGYRDRFYSELLSQLQEPHRSRLATEAQRRQQPFGAARQHLNRQLARFRAFQMVHVNLALVFSRMGYETAAIRHANILPVASARMVCQIECLIFAGTKALETDNLALSSETLPRLFDLLKRAVECGAIIDPWNILGFDANFGLFHGTENTVRDHRADDLAQLMEQIFSFASKVWIAAQAADKQQVSDQVSAHFREIVDWWHKFAVHQVSSIDSVDALEIYAATRDVAKLINQWQKEGEETGNVRFWAKNAQSFMSARAYILAISSLIHRNDFETSMVLLIHWLTQSDLIPLQQNTGSFQSLAAEWITRQKRMVTDNPTVENYQATWKRVQKFCDFVEANAGDLWQVPRFGKDSNVDSLADDPSAENDSDDDSGDNLYRAAYEDMVYRESTNDGVDGSIYDPGQHSDESIQAEMQRIADRLEFLHAIADYWSEAARFVNHTVAGFQPESLDAEFVRAQRQKIDDWVKQANNHCSELTRLIRSIQAHALPEPSGSTASLIEYDRQRLFKETLLDQSINLTVETTNASYLLESLSQRLQKLPGQEHAETPPPEKIPEPGERDLWVDLVASLLANDKEKLIEQFDELLPLLAHKPLLYVPLSKGGNPLQIVNTRIRQCQICQLLENLPGLGLLGQSRELLHVALMMERKQTVRQGAVTEFDEMFRIGYTAMVDTLIKAFRAANSQANIASNDDNVDDQSDDSQLDETENDASEDSKSLIDCLETLANSMLMLWLSHSQTLRLSVMEKVRTSREGDDTEWERMVKFIDQFGDGIFTQRFLSLSNIRAILHQGVDQWLESVEQEESDEFGWQVVRHIQNGYERTVAVKNLTWVLEAVIENFNEYRDYNCTTTQSDNGRLLYVFLDFLRLRCRYDQVCWNLKPVIWAHDSLVRQNETEAASQWRRLLAERVKPEADRLLEKLADLQQRHSIQMATVGQRISERFIHPMQVDRLTCLIAKAMENPQCEESQTAFELIENYAESLTQNPIGVGFELPGWISALQNEVDFLSSQLSGYQRSGKQHLVEDHQPDFSDLLKQIESMPRRSWGDPTQ